MTGTDDHGYMNISFPKQETPQNEEETLEEIEADNPFFESDLPLSQLADEGEKEE